MKKTLFMSAVVSLLMFSCSSDDTTNSSTSELSRSANKEFKLFTTSNTSGKASVTDLNETTPIT